MSDISTAVAAVAEVITKGTTPTVPFVNAGVHFIKVESLADGRIDPGRVAHIDKRTHDAHRRSQLRPFDVLFTIAGTIGRVALVTEDILPANTNQAVALIRPNTDLVVPRYLYYALLGGGGVRDAGRRIVQSVQANLSLGELGRLSIPLPALSTQRSIAEVLGALDDKIDLNRRTISTTAQLRYALIESALKDVVPNTPLSKLADFVNGRAFTALAEGIGRPILRIRELNSGIDAGTPRMSHDVPLQHLAQPDTLLLAWSGSVGMYRWHGPEAVINQHIFKVIPRTAPYWLVEYWCQKHVADFRSIAADKATTMGHIQRHHLDEAMCRVSNPAELDRLDSTVAPMYALEHALSLESSTLAELRDAIMPELIAGRMTVRDAAAVVSPPR